VSKQWIHVVAAVIENDQQEILLAKRSQLQHQGGLWEFPGGKVESNEEAFNALQRELQEELAITIHSSRPFIKIFHHYSDKSIFLDVYKVRDFDGVPKGNEGQEVQWVNKDDVAKYPFPEANTKIVKALNCPESISITVPDFNLDFCTKERIAKLSTLNIGALVLRAPQLNDEQYTACFKKIEELSSSVYLENQTRERVKVFINRPELVEKCFTASGLHLSSSELLNLPNSFHKKKLLLSASCHNESELQTAKQKGCDFVFISPVNTTPSHPESQPLTWKGFESLAKKSYLPSIALGGIKVGDLATVKERSGFGVAGISSFGMS